MGHKVSVEVSPVIRQDDKTSIIALRLSRTKDDTSINAVDAHFDNSDDNKLSISNYLGVPSVFRPGSGASWTKLLDLSAAQSSLDQSSHAAPKLADPVAIERYTRSLDRLHQHSCRRQGHHCHPGKRRHLRLRLRRPGSQEPRPNSRPSPASSGSIPTADPSPSWDTPTISRTTPTTRTCPRNAPTPSDKTAENQKLQ